MTLELMDGIALAVVVREVLIGLSTPGNTNCCQKRQQFVVAETATNCRLGQQFVAWCGQAFSNKTRFGLSLRVAATVLLFALFCSLH